MRSDLVLFYESLANLAKLGQEEPRILLLTGMAAVITQGFLFSKSCREPAMWGGARVSLLFFAILAGCAGPESVHTSWVNPPGNVPIMGKDIVQIDVALLELPLGDPFINHELWNNTDEQIVDLEHKAGVDDNGFRIGQIIGITPGHLQGLLTSKRSCINPRRRLLPAGRETKQMLGPVLAHVSYRIKQNDQTTVETLDQVQFLLEVIPTITRDRHVCLNITPKAQYGESLPDLKPSADGSDWAYELSKPCKSYPSLTWKITLAANDLLVVGASIEQPHSLGYHAFIQEEQAGQEVQRLLVIRTMAADGNEQDVGQSPPLAFQATQSGAVRANGQ